MEQQKYHGNENALFLLWWEERGNLLMKWRLLLRKMYEIQIIK
jgi:hypothetical protein